jgi:hypothetical protein
LEAVGSISVEEYNFYWKSSLWNVFLAALSTRDGRYTHCPQGMQLIYNPSGYFFLSVRQPVSDASVVGRLQNYDDTRRTNGTD